MMEYSEGVPIDNKKSNPQAAFDSFSRKQK